VASGQGEMGLVGCAIARQGEVDADSTQALLGRREITMSGQMILDIVTMLVTMFLSLTVHEFAHAAAAKYLGDDTAERMGRLTLNPLAHIDLIGTVGLPILLVVTGSGFFFGWAKPVPVTPARFDRRYSMRTGMMITAVAGPVANLVMAVLVTAILAVPYHAGFQLPAAFFLFLQNMLMLNVALAVFNMIPAYPLDGQKVIAGLLPTESAIRFERFNARYGSWILIAVVMFGSPIMIIPIRLILSLLLTVFGM